MIFMFVGSICGPDFEYFQVFSIFLRFVKFLKMLFLRWFYKAFHGVRPSRLTCFLFFVSFFGVVLLMFF